MTRLLLDAVPSPPSAVDVEGEELRYLTRVRRHVAGDRIEVRDREGGRYRARIADVTGRRARLEIEGRLPAVPDSHPVTMLVAVPKGARFDDVVRKLSELGAASLVPVIAARSNVTPGPGRLQRWRRIAVESIRQCGRRAPLDVAEVEELTSALVQFETADRKLILDPGIGEKGLLRKLNDSKSIGKIVIAVGPEGGFTPDELETARRLGYDAVGLGPSILRIETAAIAAAALAVAICNDID